MTQSLQYDSSHQFKDIVSATRISFILCPTITSSMSVVSTEKIGNINSQFYKQTGARHKNLYGDIIVEKIDGNKGTGRARERVSSTIKDS